MARLAKLFVAVQVDGSNSWHTVATVPVGKKWEITEIIIVSFDASVARLVFTRASGADLTVSLVQPNSMFIQKLFQVANAGDTIDSHSPSANLTLRISGVEVDV